MYNDSSKITLHRLCLIASNCPCEWLSDCPSARETFVNSFLFPEKITAHWCLLHLATDPFCPKISCGVVPRILRPSVKIQFRFGGYTSWNTHPNCIEFFNMATEPLPRVSFGFFVGLTAKPFCAIKVAFFTESASRFFIVILARETMPRIT